MADDEASFLDRARRRLAALRGEIQNPKRKCPDCGASVPAEKLQRHREKIHE